jgi:hypothetical protein
MFVQQKTKFPIKVVKLKEKNVHNSLFPNNLRCLICGPSGCGKTVLLFNLIVQKEGLKFTNLYIVSQSLEQEKYKMLRDIFDNVEEVNLNMMQTCEITPNDVPVGSVVVFDDVKDNGNIAMFFSMGRHRKLNCFYLCQTYSKIGKQLLRDNSNFIILFKQDDLNLKHVYNNHVGSDFTFQQFKNLCNECWNSDDYGFVVIDKTSPLNNGRYRCKFDKFYCGMA